MNEITIFKNEELGLQVRTINGYLKELGFSQDVAKDDYIPESLMLGFKAGNERALKYQQWLAIDVLPSIRKTGTYSIPKDKPSCIEDVLIQSLKEMKEVRLQVELQNQQIDKLDSKVDSIKEVVALDTTSWRIDTRNLLNKIADSLGGGMAFQQVRTESYELLEKRMGVSLKIRLTNKRRRMAEEGICKSKRDKVTNVDIISEDKKLIEGYTAIIKEMAIKYGVADRGTN